MDLSGTKLIGRKRLVKGLTLFEVNTTTGEIKPAEVASRTDYGCKSEVFKRKMDITKHSVVVNPKCIYIQALNKQNAAKKLLKLAGVDLRNPVIPKPENKTENN